MRILEYVEAAFAVLDTDARASVMREAGVSPAVIAKMQVAAMRTDAMGRLRGGS